MTQWLLNIPQEGDNDNAPNWLDANLSELNGNNTDPARAFSGTWTDYFGSDGEIIGIPIQGAFINW